MKSEFKLTVPKPCQEKWNNFSPTDQGRFCNACQKEVIDFTSWDIQQIQSFFGRQTQRVCGRFKTQQLSLAQAAPYSHTSWMPAPLLALLLLLCRPTEAQAQKTVTPQEQVDKQKLPVNATQAVVKKMVVTGMVRERPDSTLLPGVNVVRKGTDLGVVTDANGKFELTIINPKPSETLQLSFIGLITIERTIPATSVLTSLDIVMDPDESILGETVVMGGVDAPRFSPRRVWWWMRRGFRR